MTTLRRELGDLGTFRNGLNYSKANLGHGLKVIGVKDFGDRWRPDTTVLDEIDPAGLRVDQHDLREGDILFVRSNGNRDLVGRSMLIQDDLDDVSFSGFCIRFRPEVRELNSTYLSLYFKTPLFRQTLSLQGKGTSINNLNQKILSSMSIPWPTGVEQDRIVEVISAYNDLIENNRRRIALLEEAARLLFREWFVHFRFPGHEHGKTSDGLPAGWERRHLFDEADATYGHAFKSALFNDAEEGLPVVRIRDVPNGVSATWTTEEATEDCRLTNGDLLIGMDGDFHMNFWIGGEAWLNQRVTKIDADGSMSLGLLRFALEEPIKILNKTITGTTVKHLGAKHLRQIELTVPPRGLLEHANSFFHIIRELIVNLGIQNLRLGQARDLLLPRLMSGKIAV